MILLIAVLFSGLVWATISRLRLCLVQALEDGGTLLALEHLLGGLEGLRVLNSVHLGFEKPLLLLFVLFVEIFVLVVDVLVEITTVLVIVLSHELGCKFALSILDVEVAAPLIALLFNLSPHFLDPLQVFGVAAPKTICSFHELLETGGLVGLGSRCRCVFLADHRLVVVVGIHNVSHRLIEVLWHDLLRYTTLAVVVLGHAKVRLAAVYVLRGFLQITIFLWWLHWLNHCTKTYTCHLSVLTYHRSRLTWSWGP